KSDDRSDKSAECRAAHYRGTSLPAVLGFVTSIVCHKARLLRQELTSATRGVRPDTGPLRHPRYRTAEVIDLAAARTPHRMVTQTAGCFGRRRPASEGHHCVGFPRFPKVPSLDRMAKSSAPPRPDGPREVESYRNAALVPRAFKRPSAGSTCA